ncbi:lipase secretion chaperone [Pseudomonas sp. sp1636]|uniref:lipase secretion chaperone n=1 Tax=Pseudomonas sp. sp1636 TaxID=3036707 RepID=UPI0025A5D61E|nr:lipase secretion chaperone [Pseudomonas sp. sp1636]MDM8350010.1 lipase secretion chaperone [Pseudomonas sp. sp1636]
MPLPIRSIIPLAMLAIGAAGLTLYWQWPESAAALVDSASQAQVVTPAIASPSLPQPAPTAVAPTAPVTLLPGMNGTEVDGELKIDSAGNLQLDLALRDYFDYFLSAVDQAGLDASVEALLADANARLQEPALGQLIGLLGDYLEYKRASLALLQQPLNGQQQLQPQAQLAALQQAFDSLAELRRRHFSAGAVEALFGAEEAYARYTLDSLAILGREDLSEQGKADAQQRLRGQLPAAMRASEERQLQAQEQRGESERLWREGASEEQVRQSLALSYDPATVERLLLEQRSERAWQQRYTTYREQLATLHSNGLSPADQQYEQQRLRQRLFSAADQHRVDTYDAIAAKQQVSEPAEP